MLREEQIDLRRRRAAEAHFTIRNLGRNRVFSDYQITNPTTGGSYKVSIRGFDVGDNTCECPDFRANTLGTCKHIEAVLASLAADAPRKFAARRPPSPGPRSTSATENSCSSPPPAATTLRPAAGARRRLLRLPRPLESGRGLPAPPRPRGRSAGTGRRPVRRDGNTSAARSTGTPWPSANANSSNNSTAGSCLDLLNVPLYAYQMRGALFAAFRGRCILGDDMGLGKTVQTLAAAELLARERGIERVLVVAPASVKYQWETEVRKYTGRPVQVIEGTTAERRGLYKQSTFYRLVNYEIAVRDLDELNAWQPDLIVLDEAQRIKNWASKTSMAVKKLEGRLRHRATNAERC